METAGAAVSEREAAGASVSVTGAAQPAAEAAKTGDAAGDEKARADEEARRAYSHPQKLADMLETYRVVYPPHSLIYA